LREDAPTNDAEPDVDWLNVFTSYAEKASTERMQKHWASVLAGEIRRPGSFSLTTLQLLSVVDSELAQIIVEVPGWLVEQDFIPVLGQMNQGDPYTKLMKLDAIGFLRLGSAKYLETVAADQPSYIRFADKRLAVRNLRGTHHVQAAVLTVAGRQVMPLLGPQPADAELLQAFANHLRGAGAVVEVEDAQ